MRLLALLIGLFAVAVGLVGVATPSTLLMVGQVATTAVGLLVLAILRIAIGVVLIQVASTSSFPKILRAIGVIAVVSGVVTALIGADRAQALLAWEAAQGLTAIRIGAVLPMVVGSFIVFAVGARPAA